MPQPSRELTDDEVRECYRLAAEDYAAYLADPEAQAEDPSITLADCIAGRIGEAERLLWVSEPTSLYRIVFVFPSTGNVQGECTTRFATRGEARAYAESCGYDPNYYDVRECVADDGDVPF